MSVSIDSSGQVAATLTPTPGGPSADSPNPAAEINGSVTGTISSTGNASLSQTTSSNTVKSANGVLTLDARGHLVGNLLELSGPVPGLSGTYDPIVTNLGTIHLDLIRQP